MLYSDASSFKALVLAGVLSGMDLDSPSSSRRLGKRTRPLAEEPEMLSVSSFFSARVRVLCPQKKRINLDSCCYHSYKGSGRKDSTTFRQRHSTDLTALSDLHLASAQNSPNPPISNPVEDDTKLEQSAYAQIDYFRTLFTATTFDHTGSRASESMEIDNSESAVAIGLLVNPPQRKRFTMGYREDCEACKRKVPGHVGHIRT